MQPWRHIIAARSIRVVQWWYYKFNSDAVHFILKGRSSFLIIKEIKNPEHNLAKGMRRYLVGKRNIWKLIDANIYIYLMHKYYVEIWCVKVDISSVLQVVLGEHLVGMRRWLVYLLDYIIFEWIKMLNLKWTYLSMNNCIKLERVNLFQDFDLDLQT